MSAVSRDLGIIAQLPGLSTYCIILLGFALPDDSQRPEVICNLEQSAIKLSEIYPWLSGQIVHDKPQGEDALKSSGSYRIAPYDAHDGKPWVQIEDCTAILPSYEEYTKAKAPMSMLDASTLTPFRGIPDGHDYSKPAPVILLQLNLIKGGMLLAFNGMHHAFDMTGLGTLIRQYATLCRGETLTMEQIATGNRSQTDAIPPLQPGVEADPISQARRESKLAKPGWAGMPVAAPWLYYRFPAATCAKLKKEVEDDIAKTGQKGAWISKNDVIVAFFWMHLALARLKRLDETKISSSSILRPIQGRRSLEPPLPADYFGHVVTVIPTQFSIRDLKTSGLSQIALRLRQDLQKANDHHFRSFAHLLTNEQDKTTFGYEATMNPDIDIMPSTWSVGLYETDFGKGLGKPDFVRRPRLSEIMSLAYVMPTTREGHIDLCISLMEDDIKALEEDSVFAELVEKIG